MQKLLYRCITYFYCIYYRKRKKGEFLEAFYAGDVDRVLYLARRLPEHAKKTIPIAMHECNTQPEKYSPLLSAILCYNYHLCKLLIEEGASITREYMCQPCPLSLALKEKQSDIANLLIASGVDVNTTDYANGTTYPLHYAIYHHNAPSTIENIIKAGFHVDTPVVLNENLKAIHCASLSNNIDAAEILVKYKANLNAVNFRCENAINIAARQNFLEMVVFLVRKGANLHNRSTSICPLFLAIRMEFLKMVELLLDLGVSIKEGWVATETVPPLQFACSYLNYSIIMLLIKRGADVNVKNVISNETPLHVTCFYIGTKYTGETLAALQTKVAKALIDKGANVNAKDRDGRTPLDCAIYSENTDLCKLLLREGADITQMGNINGEGTFSNRFEYIACVSAFKCPELIKLCLERGCDYNHRDKHGLTPYHCAMAKHNPEMVKVFWQHGCPFDQKEHIPGKMQSMLWYNPDSADKEILEIQSDFIDGIKHNNVEKVRSALEKGAEPRGCSLEIQSTLHYAAANGNHKLVELLLNNSVPVNKINKEGQSPLDVAVEKKYLETCKVLLKFGASLNYKKNIKGKPFNVLTKEDKNLHSLFKNIYHTFKMAKKGNLRLLSVLKQCVSKGDLELLQILMNCVNNQGLSLIGVTLISNHLQLARELMLLRVTHFELYSA